MEIIRCIITTIGERNNVARCANIAGLHSAKPPSSVSSIVWEVDKPASGLCCFFALRRRRREQGANFPRRKPRNRGDVACPALLSRSQFVRVHRAEYSVISAKWYPKVLECLRLIIEIDVLSPPLSTAVLKLGPGPGLGRGVG